MLNKKTLPKLMALALMSAFIFLWASSEVLARAGGGMSGGSRGSRSYSAPRTMSPSTPTPGAPSSGMYNQAQPNAPSMGSPLLRGLAGGLAGGFLGSMLFSGLGHGAMGSGGGGGGIGFLEILLLGIGAFLLFRFIRNRKRTAESQTQQTNYTPPPYAQDPYPPQAPASEQTVEAGIGHIQSMDARFNPTDFKDWVQDLFFKIQAAWTNQDLALLTPFLAPEIKAMFSQDLEGQKARGQVNRLENISVRSVDITEAWQEEGKDYITVLFYANLLDYLEDKKTGTLVSGSKTEPVKFREYWTFTRPVGGQGTWLLSAIQQES
jgi:predicted lipid-binding transport protein (Tim44 family)